MRPSSEEGFRLGLLPEGGLLLTKQSRCPLEAPPDFVSETQALPGLNAAITEHGGGASRPHPRVDARAPWSDTIYGSMLHAMPLRHESYQA